MKVFIIFIMFISCSSDKIFDKQLKNSDINVDWYHYSYITSSSPNYVTVTKNSEENIIFQDGYGIQDIELNKDTIIIFHLKFLTKPTIMKDNVFEYKVKYQEVDSHELYLKNLNKNKTR